MDQAKVSSGFHFFRTIKKISSSILDTLVTMLLMCGENDINDVNNTST